MDFDGLQIEDLSNSELCARIRNLFELDLDEDRNALSALIDELCSREL